MKRKLSVILASSPFFLSMSKGERKVFQQLTYATPSTASTCQKLVCSLEYFLQQRSVLLIELIFELFAHGVNRRELVAPFIGPGGIDDGSRVEALSFLGNSRIQWAAPGAPDDIDVFGLGACGHGPDNIVGVINVDV